MEDGLLKEDHALFKMLMNNAPSWWQPIKEDKDLYIEVRKGNVIDIYFQGGRMAEVKIVNKRLIVTAHPKYLGHTDEDDEKYYKRGKKDGKTVYTPIYQDCEVWLTNRREELKANIRSYYSGAENGENTSEKFIQGKLIINGRDKYLDSEFAHRHYEGDRKTIRIDLIKIEKGKIVFEELKRICDSRLRTTDGKPEIIEQMNNYREFIRKNKTALTKYYRTLYLIKKNLGLPVPQIVDVNKL